MKAGRKRQLYYDKTNKSYYNFVVDKKTGRRRKVYLVRVKGKTNDPEGRALALKRWEEIKEQEGMTPQKRYQERGKKLKDGLRVDNRGCRPKTTMYGIGDLYLYAEKQRVRSEEITPHTYKANVHGVKLWWEFMGREVVDDNASTAMNHARLTGFLTWLKRHVNEGRFKRSSAILRWATVIRMFNFAHDRGYIEYEPRTKFLTWRKGRKERERQRSKKIIYFTAKEIRSLLQYEPRCGPHSSVDTRLLILLGLNCGFLGQELATLQRNHIKFNDQGEPVRIEKARTKSGVEGSWLLWPATSRMLKSHIEEEGLIETTDLIFRTSSGRPLIYTNPETANKVDNVRRWFKNHSQGAGTEDGKTYRHLRKTGATMLAKLTEGRYPLLEQLYLAHTPNSVARLHYVAIDVPLLDEKLQDVGRALLGTWYEGIDTET